MVPVNQTARNISVACNSLIIHEDTDWKSCITDPSQHIINSVFTAGLYILLK